MIGCMHQYDVREYWSRVADEIASRPEGDVVAGDPDPVSRYRRERFLEKFLRRIPVAGQSVLELGCGPGGNLVEISRAGASRIVGCDVSPRMLELAKRNTVALAALELREINGVSLPFPDREFDVSFTVTVLQHNHDDQMQILLAELCRTTDKTLVLMEETGDHHDASYSFVARRVAEYTGVCKTNRFDLVEAIPLNIDVSEQFSRAMFRVLARYERMLRKRHRREGEAFPRGLQALTAAGLVATQPLDRLSRQRRGLTKIVFERRKASAP